MKERPILMSAPGVRAILANTKTQTRRLVKPKQAGRIVGASGPGTAMEYLGRDNEGLDCFSTVPCPYGQPGDRLWVREAWAYHTDFPESCQRAIYRAERGVENDVERWKPSIHMPRWASRIFLEVTSIRVERLHDISETDAQAEGARAADPATGRECILDPTLGSHRLHFRDIWEQINGHGSWVANPWVWVVAFKRVQP